MHVRDGYLLLLVYLPAVFGERFSGHVRQVIQPILNSLSDETEFIRDTAMKAGRRIIELYAEQAVELLLPELENGLLARNWRIRHASVRLLGDLMFRLIGVSGRGTTEGADEDDTFGSEQATSSVTRVLGEDTRQRVLAKLYMTRHDSNSLAIRQEATHVWKVVVSNTARTLREIIPALFELLLACLGASQSERRKIAAATLAELVKKLGERILPDLFVLLENQLKTTTTTTKSSTNSSNTKNKLGVCSAMSEIMRTCSREQISGHADRFYACVRLGLADAQSRRVRTAAADAFELLHSNLGIRALDEVLPGLLRAINQSKTSAALVNQAAANQDQEQEEDSQSQEEAAAVALDSLCLLMRNKSKVVMPFIVPRLVSPVVQTSAFLRISECVPGEAIARHLKVIQPALLNAVVQRVRHDKTHTDTTSTTNTTSTTSTTTQQQQLEVSEETRTEVEQCSKVLGAIRDAHYWSGMMQDLLGAIAGSSKDTANVDPEMQEGALLLLAGWLAEAGSNRTHKHTSTQQQTQQHTQQQQKKNKKQPRQQESDVEQDDDESDEEEMEDDELERFDAEDSDDDSEEEDADFEDESDNDDDDSNDERDEEDDDEENDSDEQEIDSEEDDEEGVSLGELAGQLVSSVLRALFGCLVQSEEARVLRAAVECVCTFKRVMLEAELLADQAREFRQALLFAHNKMRTKLGLRVGTGAGAGEWSQLPGLCLCAPYDLLDQLVDVYKTSLSGAGGESGGKWEQREEAAHGLLEALHMSDAETLSRSAVKVAGAVIRMMGQGFGSSTKLAFVCVFEVLLERADVRKMRPFATQMHNILTKCLFPGAAVGAAVGAVTSSKKEMRVRAGAAIGHLSPLLIPATTISQSEDAPIRRHEQLVLDLTRQSCDLLVAMTSSTSTTTGVGSTGLQAVRLCLDKIGGQIRIKVLLELIEMITSSGLQPSTKSTKDKEKEKENLLENEDEQVRKTAAASVATGLARAAHAIHNNTNNSQSEQMMDQLRAVLANQIARLTTTNQSVTKSSSGSANQTVKQSNRLHSLAVLITVLSKLDALVVLLAVAPCSSSSLSGEQVASMETVVQVVSSQLCSAVQLQLVLSGYRCLGHLLVQLLQHTHTSHASTGAAAAREALDTTLQTLVKGMKHECVDVKLLVADICSLVAWQLAHTRTHTQVTPLYAAIFISTLTNGMRDKNLQVRSAAERAMLAVVHLGPFAHLAFFSSNSSSSPPSQVEEENTSEMYEQCLKCLEPASKKSVFVEMVKTALKSQSKTAANHNQTGEMVPPNLDDSYILAN